MPFRYNPSHWRERAAQMRALAVDTTDTEAAHLCSSWRKTTTSLRIALEYARKNSRNQKRSFLATVSRSRVPDSGSCRSRASGAIAQQRRQLGDVGSDPPRLVARQQLCRRSPAGLLLEIDVRQRLPASIVDDEAGVVVASG